MSNPSADEPFQVALGHHLSGRRAEAETLYREILARSPSHFPALHMLGILAAEFGRFQDAASLLGRAAAIHPSNVAVRSDLANALRQAGRLEEAAAVCREAVRLQPGNPEAQNNLGALLNALGIFDEALRACSAAVRARPDYADAHSNLGNALYGCGRRDAASDSYRRALDIQPSLLVVLQNLSGALGEAVIECRQRGEPGRADALVREILNRNVENAATLRTVSRFFMQRGDYQDAVSLLQSAVKIEPSSVTIRVELAAALRGAGRAGEAATVCVEALSATHGDPEAYNDLGVFLCEMNRPRDAVRALLRAVRLDPDYADAFYNLGNALQDSGKNTGALTAHRRALQIDPAKAKALDGCGRAFEKMARWEEAIAHFRRALELTPADARIWTNLGCALQGCGNFEEAIGAHRGAIQIDPEFAIAHRNLGSALGKKGSNVEAAEEFRKALALDPRDVRARTNLGCALQELDHWEEGMAEHREAIRLEPGFALAHENLGAAYCARGRLDEAIAAQSEAIRIDPRAASAHNNLGCAFFDTGRVDLAVACYRRAAQLDPASAEFKRNVASAVCYEGDPDRALAEAKEWDRSFGAPFRKARHPHPNAKTVDRRLRIGYVSADFARHVVGMNLLPLTRAHDRGKFEIFCYSSTTQEDGVTAEFERLSDGWRRIACLSDSDAAEMIRRDGIDILVDLSLHTAGNRLLIFARKPAPVQATYLGYCGTTGLEAIDYRLSDPFFDPPELPADRYYSEKTMRIRSYWCYQPLGECPEISVRSASSSESIVFGSLNRASKLSAMAIRTWGKILAAMPRASLLIGAPAESSRARIREELARLGVSAERVCFVGRLSWAEYIQTWSTIDIGLDPFPYCGGISTCDALWMGVPVITLSGATAVGRAGCSILSNLGLPGLITQTPEQYVKTALMLANDLPRLAELRATLRERMERSPLRDGKAHARDIEEAYRKMWLAWCTSGTR